MIYRKGDPVPREWFEVYDHVESAVFGADVEVTTLDNGSLHVEHADKTSEEPIIIVMGKEGKGAVLRFAQTTYFHMTPRGSYKLEKWHD